MLYAPRRVVYAHTPDPDDAFMFYGFHVGAVSVPGVEEFEEMLADIETLNEFAASGRGPELTALSVHAALRHPERYIILRCGASMGYGYGPVVVARSSLDLRGARVAVPGRLTTAALLLKLAVPEARTVEARFDEIPGMVARGEVDAGVLIHEEQIAFERRGLVKVLDLWDWWEAHFGRLPLPLGVDAARSDLGLDFASAASRALRESILYAYEHFSDAVRYAARFSRVGDLGLVARFIRMYVNEVTIDMGWEGVQAIRVLGEAAREAGLLEGEAEPIFSYW